MTSTEEQGVANAVAGLPTSRFTAINSKGQPTTAASNGTNRNSRRGSSSANSYHSYTILSSAKQTPTTATSKSYNTREEDLREQSRPDSRDSHVPEAQSRQFITRADDNRETAAGDLGYTRQYTQLSTLVDNWEKYCRELCKIWIRSNVTATILAQPIITDLPTRTPPMGMTEERCLRKSGRKSSAIEPRPDV